MGRTKSTSFPDRFRAMTTRTCARDTFTGDHLHTFGPTLYLRRESELWELTGIDDVVPCFRGEGDFIFPSLIFFPATQC